LIYHSILGRFRQTSGSTSASIATNVLIGLLIDDTVHVRGSTKVSSELVDLCCKVLLSAFPFNCTNEARRLVQTLIGNTVYYSALHFCRVWMKADDK
jgi:hypothetical protein